MANQQRHAQIALELAYLQPECRLRNEKLLGRLGDVAGFDRLCKIA
jgi:hypothetical protein